MNFENWRGHGSERKKEKWLYLSRRLQDMNAGFRVVYVAGKDILYWLLLVTLIVAVLTQAVVSEDVSILRTWIYLVFLTGQACEIFKNVKRKRKLLRRFGNTLWSFFQWNYSVEQISTSQKQNLKILIFLFEQQIRLAVQ